MNYNFLDWGLIREGGGLIRERGGGGLFEGGGLIDHLRYIERKLALYIEYKCVCMFHACALSYFYMTPFEIQCRIFLLSEKRENGTI